MKSLFKNSAIINIEEINSTNVYAAKILEKNENITEGTIFSTYNQTSGKGQRGNVWYSDKGKNLTFSIVLYPGFVEMSNVFMLNKAIALGINDFLISKTQNIQQLSNNIQHSIKWPNDIYVGDKKIAGILIENVYLGNKIKHTIAGIGININQEDFPENLPNPVSLKNITGISYLLHELVEEAEYFLSERYFQLKEGEYFRINSDYHQYLYRFEEIADYIFKGVNIKARITNVSHNGKLILQDMTNNKEIEADIKEISFV